MRSTGKDYVRAGKDGSQSAEFLFAFGATFLERYT